MTHDYTLTEEEYYERNDLKPLKCSEANCGHYDALNQTCWRSWRDKQEGDTCSYGYYLDENSMVVKVIWNKKEATP